MNKTDIDNVRRGYQRRLTPSGTDRCVDCAKSVAYVSGWECTLLGIVIENALKSRCPAHSPAEEG